MRALAAGLLLLCSCVEPRTAIPPSGASAGGDAGAPGTGGTGGTGGNTIGPGGTGGTLDADVELAPDGTSATWTELASLTPGPPLTDGALCRPDGWCWTDPLPTGLPLFEGWVGDHDVWLGGRGELLRWDGQHFTSSAWRFDADVQAMSGTGDSLWVVMNPVPWPEEVGVFDGTRWRHWVAPASPYEYRTFDILDVAAVSPDEAWLLVHDWGQPSEATYLLNVNARDGTFRPYRPTHELSLLAIDGRDGVLVAATTDGVIEWDRGAWRRTSLRSPMRRVCTTFAGETWATGHLGTFRRGKDGSWKQVNDDELDELRCGATVVAGPSRFEEGNWTRLGSDGKTEVLDFGERSFIAEERSGDMWSASQAHSLAAAIFRGDQRMDGDQGLEIDALGEDMVGRTWASGAGLWRFDRGWNELPAPRGELTSLAVDAQAYAAHARGVERLDGTEPRFELPGAVVAGRGEVVFAAGEGGSFFRRMNGAWVRQNASVPGKIVSMAVVAPDLVWLLQETDDAQLLRRFDGSDWTTVFELEKGKFDSIGLDDGNVALAGGKLAVLRDASLDLLMFKSWSYDPITSIAAHGSDFWWVRGGDLFGMHGDDAVGKVVRGARRVRVSPGGEPWVVGAGGRVLRLAGTELLQVPTDTSADLTNLTFEDDRVAVVGKDGVLLLGDASALSQVETGTTEDLQAVALLGDHTFLGLRGKSGGAGLLELKDGALDPMVGAVEVRDFYRAGPTDLWAAASPYAMHLLGDVWNRIFVNTWSVGGTGRDVYLGHSDGLSQWNGGTVEELWRGGRLVNEIAAGDDALWTLEGGGDEAAVFLYPSGERQEPPTALAGVMSGPEHVHWVAIAPGGPYNAALVPVTDGVPDVDSTRSIKLPGPVRLMREDRAGRLWAVMDDDVRQYVLRKDR